MEFSTLIAQRYSVRKFTTQPVDPSDLTAILEAARLAPTAVNKQPARILVLEQAESLAKLKSCTPYTFDAPLALIVCYDETAAWVRSFDEHNSGAIDAAIVGCHIMLKVHDMGLGSTWVGHFDPVKIHGNKHRGDQADQRPQEKAGKAELGPNPTPQCKMHPKFTQLRPRNYTNTLP